MPSLADDPTVSVTTAGAISSDTRFITLSSGLMAGPAVSLNGSPTVSPMMVASCASDPLPPKLPSSTIFLALSQEPPELARKTAIRVPVAIQPARYPASGPTPSPNPTAIGANTASRPGVASSCSESRVTMSTTLPYSGLLVPSMIPGISRNWRRTSMTTAPAARATALTASPENRNTTAAPSSMPTSVSGDTTLAVNTLTCWPAETSAVAMASEYEPNSAVAAN